MKAPKKPPLIDRLVGYLSPTAGVARANARQKLAEFGYQQARRNRIQVAKTGLGGSADKHACTRDLWTLREYSRALDRDNVIASAMLDRACDFVIGTGIDVQVQSGSKTWDDRLEKLWHHWWEYDADIRGVHTGPQLEALCYRAMKVDGDVLLIMTQEGKVQCIEADRIMTPSDVKDGSKLCSTGVEVDKQGKPIAYWVAPDSEYRRNVSYGKKEMTRVPAENAVFLADMKRLSQTRGVPVFSTNLQLFDDIDAFVETCILHAKVATSHVMFVERQGGGVGLDGVETTEDSYDQDRQVQTTAPGMILYGNPGESAKMVGSTQSMVQFGPFVNQLLRFTGLNFGMPLELLSLDFSHTNFSSARASLQVAHRSFLTQHRIVLRKLIEPILRWKTRQWVADGAITPREFEVSATPPKMIQVDPLKEANAQIANVQHGFSTNRDVCAAQGLDYYDLLAQRALEIQEASMLAEKVVKRTGAKVDWRDIIGDAGNFKNELYTEEQEVTSANTNANADD